MVVKRVLALAGSAVLAASLAACGGDDDGGGDEGGTGLGQEWILGTTDTVSAVDPAGSYDLGSSTLQYALYEQLLTVSAGSDTPEGDAAESCEYDDPQTLTCTLREGVTFANGNELTSSDVKYSFERNIAIADPNGASVLYGSIADSDDEGNLSVNPDAIETPDDQTVVFHLNQPDTTFQFILTHASASIVDEETYPEDDILPNEQAVGSGPYALEEYEHGQRALMVANEEYTGNRSSQSDRIQVNYYKQTSGLKSATENGDVQVAWRSLSPTELNELDQNPDTEVVRGEGAEIRYWVWQFSNDAAKDEATRQAVAQIFDREAVAERAYDGTVDPLYSMVPPGFAGQVDAFQDEYGQPSVQEAQQLLNDAGIDTPVDLTIGYTPTHYGPNAVDEANELKRQLDESGLFNVTIDNLEWEQYQDEYKEGAYDLFMLGWFPDFPDADNYLSPFLVDGGFYANNYKNQRINQLVGEEQSTDDPSVREPAMEEIQQITAQDVSVMPSWVGQNVAVTAPGIEGIDATLDPAFIFRFWEVSYEG